MQIESRVSHSLTAVMGFCVRVAWLQAHTMLHSVKGFVKFLCAVPKATVCEGWEIRFVFALVAYAIILELIWTSVS